MLTWSEIETRAIVFQNAWKKANVYGASFFVV